MDYEHYFKTIYNHLNYSGYFLCTFPNLQSLVRKIIKPSSRFTKGNFRFYFNMYDVLSTLKLVGFKIKKIRGIDIFLTKLFNLPECETIKKSLSFEISILAKK